MTTEGSLTAGKDADIVVWSGDPLDIRSRVLAAWVAGRHAFRYAPEGGRQVVE